MQRILVCAEDPVLAKKVRFLMERDECKVDILSTPDELDVRIREDDPNLLVLSREIDGEDTLEWVIEMDASRQLPPTLILGGDDCSTAAFVHLVPDPVDTQAIYREATTILQSARVHSALPAHAPNSEDSEVDTPHANPAVESVLDGIANELNALESVQLEESLADAFESEAKDPSMEDSMLTTEAAHPETSSTSPMTETDQPLEPAVFATALHHIWRHQQGGALIVEHDDAPSTMYFEEGRLVSVVSARRGDTLGTSLVERGRLTRAQYAEVAICAVEQGISLAEAITSLGYLTSEDLGRELGTSAKETMVSLFGSDSGRFRREPNEMFSGSDCPYRLEIPHIISQGLRFHVSAEVIDGILGAERSGYFQLERPGYELQRDFPLSKADIQFLAYESRAYNLEDAADGAQISIDDARRLIAILTICQEVTPFSPGSREFEERIREERETRRELESKVPRSSAIPRISDANAPTQDAPLSTPTPSPSHHVGALSDDSGPSFEIHNDDEMSDEEPTHFALDAVETERSIGGPMPQFPAQSEGGTDASLSGLATGAMRNANGVPIHTSAPPPPAPADADIPPMPVPSEGEGTIPRQLMFASPLPRAPDGALLDTPERVISREHFQNGVNLLGKGNFSSAEECFRDAVSLCSEEHVYLIGLARAIYYNPTYRADGKVPVLQDIVERAQQLAPDDKRVSTLAAWVMAAEVTYIRG